MNDAPKTGRHSARQHDSAPLRASDAEREQTASRLRRAASQGRLSADELEQRLDATYTARTHGELHPLVCDLAVEHEPARPRRLVHDVPVWLKVATMLAAVAFVVVLIAAVAVIGVGRSGAAAPNQPHPRIGSTHPAGDSP